MALPDLGVSLGLHGLSGLLGPGGLSGDLPEPQNDPERVRKLADEILSRPEYREPPESIIEKIQHSVGDFIDNILSGIGFGSSGAASWLAWVVLAVLIAAVAALVAWLVVSVWGDGWGSGRRSGDEGDPVILAVDEHRTPDEWLAEAERHEAAGRWSEGLLCRYRSLVTRLVDLEVIPEAVGRTAGEYVTDVAERHPSGVSSFAAATELFEAAWYGGADTGPDERDRFAGLADSVIASAARLERRRQPREPQESRA